MGGARDAIAAMRRWLFTRVEPRLRATSSYGVLLLLLTGVYVIGVAVGSAPARTANGVLAAVTLVLALMVSQARRITIVIVLSASVAAFALQVVESAVGGQTLGGIAALVVAAQLALLPFVIMNRVIRHRVVTGDTIMGLLCVYVVIGLFFGYLYEGIDVFTNDRFFVQNGQHGTADFLYFSFVTQTTLGYGDLTPAVDIGRSAAVVQALLGQLFLVTVVARFVGRVGVPGDEVNRAGSEAGS